MRRHGQVTPLYNGDCVWRRGYGYRHLASCFKFLVTWVGGRRNCSDSWGLWGAINSCLWWQLIGCGSKLHLLLLSRNVGINLDRLATFFSVQVLKLLKIPLIATEMRQCQEKYYYYYWNNYELECFIGFPTLRKAISLQVKNYNSFSRLFEIANQLLTCHLLNLVPWMNGKAIWNVN